MNATCEWIQISAAPAAKDIGARFATLWVESQEFRIVVFSMTIMVCIMTWVTTLVRGVVCAATTVLYKLQASETAASVAPVSHTCRTAVSASGRSKVHKTDGGPPPGDPPF